MRTFRFKTNLKCSGCVETITPWLNNISTVVGWKVDLQQPDAILEVEAETDIAPLVIKSVQAAGYKIEEIN